MTRPLNILIVNSGRKWIGEVGHCVALQRELTRLGHHVWLGCRRGHELHEYLQRESLPHVAFDFSGGFAPIGDTRDALRMARFIRENKIDLVHTHRGKDHWSAIFATMLSPAPVIRTRHVVTPVSPHIFNRWLYTRATPAIISVSNAAEASFNRLLPAMRNRRVILSAVDGETFQPARRSAEWRRQAAESADESRVIWIGLIGRFQHIKGQEVFLNAAGRVAREFPEARFLLAGRGESTREKRYRKIAKTHGFNDRLRIEGMIEDLPAVMASLDIGVVASLGSEGFSRVSCEYMASGVPVVATHVGGIPDILAPDVALSKETSLVGRLSRADKANVNLVGSGEPTYTESHFSNQAPHEPSVLVAQYGILVPPGDAEALADAIIKTLREADQTRARVAAALEAVRLRHDPADWAGKVERVYLEVLERKT